MALKVTLLDKSYSFRIIGQSRGHAFSLSASHPVVLINDRIAHEFEGKFDDMKKYVTVEYVKVEFEGPYQLGMTSVPPAEPVVAPAKPKTVVKIPTPVISAPVVPTPVISEGSPVVMKETKPAEGEVKKDRFGRVIKNK